jgi:3-oxoacyl-[acyl-carrier protein] reductase
MDLELSDRVAIVTGSSRGLGLASATALVTEGCRVVLCARGAETLETAAGEVRRASGRDDTVLTVVADVTTERGVAAVVDRALERWGGVDILINNVGLARGGGLVDTPDDVWREAIDATLFPAIRASRLVVPHMRARGGGTIVMIASIWGRESGGRMAYNAVKAAEISLAKALAQELAPEGIRVLSVAPGSILFPGGSWARRQESDPAEIAEFVRRELPFGRFGRADEVGNVVAFLASPRASWVSGACIPIDGCQSRSNI